MSSLREIPGAIAMPPSLGDAPGAAKIPEARVRQAPVGESALEIVGGALNDTFQTGNARASAEPLGRAVFQPKDWKEGALREAIMAPVSAVSMPGRIAASAASGPIAELASGRALSDAGWAGVLDALTAGGTEVVTGRALHGVSTKLGKIPGVATVAEPLTRAKEGFKFYTGQLDKALDLVKDRLPKGQWLDVPAIAKGAKLSVDEAMEGLKKLRGDAYKLALSQLAHKLNEAERTLVKSQTKRIPKPYAGTVLKGQAPAERFEYAGTKPQRMAATAADVIERPGRGLADVAATTPMPDDKYHTTPGALAFTRVLDAITEAPAHVRSFTRGEH